MPVTFFRLPIAGCAFFLCIARVSRLPDLPPITGERHLTTSQPRGLTLTRAKPAVRKHLEPWAHGTRKSQRKTLKWPCCPVLGLIRSRPRVSIQTLPSQSANIVHGVLIGSSYREGVTLATR